MKRTESLERETTENRDKLEENVSGKIEHLNNNIDLTKDQVILNSGRIDEINQRALVNIRRVRYNS